LPDPVAAYLNIANIPNINTTTDIKASPIDSVFFNFLIRGFKKTHRINQKKPMAIALRINRYSIGINYTHPHHIED